uniref:ankyrin repeat and MYND domain-containing protein 1 n=1 Tax=Pristiophorus japonicus TaxID=55135 RepID=UPI00398F5E5E
MPEDKKEAIRSMPRPGTVKGVRTLVLMGTMWGNAASYQGQQAEGWQGLYYMDSGNISCDKESKTLMVTDGATVDLNNGHKLTFFPAALDHRRNDPQAEFVHHVALGDLDIHAANDWDFAFGAEDPEQLSKSKMFGGLKIEVFRSADAAINYWIQSDVTVSQEMDQDTEGPSPAGGTRTPTPIPATSPSPAGGSSVTPTPAPSPQPHTSDGSLESEGVQGPLDPPELANATPAPSSLEIGTSVQVGVQKWANGWSYEGEFEGNLKHGQGEFQWANGEYYIGHFYRDHRHGKGSYIWPDGTKFTGMFYLDRKDGYGMLKMKDGSIFQGLYKGDERFGPGVMTYPNGRQDVGLWYRNHLIKLCTGIPGAFSVKDHPVYHSDMEKLNVPIKTYEEKYFWRSDPEKDPFFYPYKKLLFDDSYTMPEEVGTYSSDTDHLPLTRSYRREGDRHFFPEEALVDEDHTDKLTVTNTTPLLVEMQMHIHRHRHAQANLPWDVAAVIDGRRKGFGPKGPLECTSERLIIAAGAGDYKSVHKILNTNLVSADVADVQGHMSLIGATVVCSKDIVNLLLDNGANVNKLNDEGVSALNCCNTLYYPIKSFLHKDIGRLTNPKKAEYTSAKDPLSKGELTQKVHEAKRLAVHDRKIRVGSISNKKLPSVSLMPEMKSEELQEEESTISESDEESEDLTAPSAGIPSTVNFESSQSVRNYPLDVIDQHMLRVAHILSRNTHFKSSTGNSLLLPAEKVWEIAEMKSEHQRRRVIFNLLLRRGADPNNSTNPMAPIFFSVLAGDIDTIKSLLESGADPNMQLQSPLKGMQGLRPLHIAVAIPGPRGVKITELLLHAAANPDAGAEDEDESYEPDQLTEKESLMGFVIKSANPSGIPRHYYTPAEKKPTEDGHTPLHIASQREDNYNHAHQIVRLLLRHKANPNLLWSGHSPLSLAIASGNDLAVEELLANEADPNLPHTHAVGNPLCAALNTTYEHKRTLSSRVNLVTKLLQSGANLLMPITLAHKGITAVGTALDYGYYRYYQDTKIAQTPYHALTPKEREVYKARRFLLNFLREPFRTATIAKERKRFDNIIQQTLRSQESSDQSQLTESDQLALADLSLTAKAIFERQNQKEDKNLSPSTASERKSKAQGTVPRRQLFKFKFCYYCGRSVGVRLITCSRCKEVYYCSKACKMECWKEFHKDECYVLKVKAHTPSRKKKEGEDGTTGIGGKVKTEGKESMEGSEGMEGEPDDRSRSISPSTELDNYSYN